MKSDRVLQNVWNFTSKGHFQISASVAHTHTPDLAVILIFILKVFTGGFVHIFVTA